MSSSLVKINQQTFVKKSEILAVGISENSEHTVIEMKHDVQIYVSDITPEQVVAILDGERVP